MIRDMVWASKSGQTMPSTKDNGSPTKLMEEVNSGTLTVTSMMGSGLTIRLTDLGFTFI